MASPPKVSASIAIVCFAVVLAAFLGLHLLQPDVDPVTHRLSEYAIGRFGYLMTVAFLGACLGLLALAHSVWSSVRHTFWLGLTCGAMLVAATTDGLMALFVADPYAPGRAAPAVVTPAGHMHDLLAMTHAFFWAVAIGATPFALALDPKWRGFARVSFGLGAMVALGMGVRALAGPGALGLTQRLWIGGVLVWSLAHAVALWRRAAT